MKKWFAYWMLALSISVSQLSLANNVQDLVLGKSHQIKSEIMNETRRVNVYVPPQYGQDSNLKLPVIYMLDGGMHEDFLHIAGLIQVSIANGSMRPFILVGIENTVRRRDLTGPSENPEDKKIIPNLGGSTQYRKFITQELIPYIEREYRVTTERALLGESLAGLFTIETLLLEPDTFQTYIALDPSLWWNDQKLISAFSDKLKIQPNLTKKLYFASSGAPGMETAIKNLATIFENTNPKGLDWTYEKFPSETHATIFHPAALKAFRKLFVMDGK